ncbi:uncharacterized protein LOC128951238 [Oppia nitens]|uniref:uncharacterized protein LOC128951238 n=1 Tax=Oppia nitens TaxID=1686743 RepID=UPI0023DB1813|nr:uncharacterized protein LOC128951238 [Oppia nitens]
MVNCLQLWLTSVGIKLLVISVIINVILRDANAFFMTGLMFRRRIRRPAQTVIIVRNGGNGNGILNYPSGYKEMILSIGAFCVKDHKCVSTDTQNALYACLKDSNNSTAAYVEKFQKCTTGRTEGCDKAAMSGLQQCAAKMATNGNPPKIPKPNSECMRESLTIKNLECLRQKYPSFDKLFPLDAKPQGGGGGGGGANKSPKANKPVAKNKQNNRKISIKT